MHLVFLNQYFPPDEAPTGRMLEAVVGKLAEQGHEVTVICAAGRGYAAAPAAPAAPAAQGPASLSKVRILRIGATSFGRGRFLAKLADYLGFYLGSAWKLATLRPRPDRIVALTTPPYLSLLARIFSRMRGGDHAHWVMDLYPDVMVAHGMLREEGPSHRSLRMMARLGWGGGRNTGILTLGPDMRERVARLMPRAATKWVPLWPAHAAGGASNDGMAEAASGLRRARGWKEDELVLMYSGNMGLGHRFGEFLEASLRSGPGVRWVFHGGGKRRAEIEALIAQHPEAPVELHDYVAYHELPVHLSSADVHLASLDPSWDGTMVPSKLQGIAASGRAVIFVGSGESSIGCWIKESKAGWVVPPGELEALEQAVREARNPAERERRGSAAAVMAGRLFDAATNVAAVAAFLTRAGATPRTSD